MGVVLVRYGCSRGVAKSSSENRSPSLILRWRVALPQVFESFRQGLLLHGAIAVAGVLREHELIMIVLGRELSRHEFIGDYVIVPHRVRSVKVAIAHLDPQPDRLARVLGDQVLVNLPGPIPC